MKRFLVGIGVSSLVLLTMACSSPDTKGACEKFDSLCSSSQGGVTITVKCDADALDDASNADDVVDCVKRASDCSSATACMLTAKK